MCEDGLEMKTRVVCIYSANVKEILIGFHLYKSVLLVQWACRVIYHRKFYIKIVLCVNDIMVKFR